MMKRALIVLAVLMACGCASTQRFFSYPGGWPDADVHVGGYRYQLWFHPVDQTIWIERGDPRPMSEATALNVTRYADDRTQPEAIWRAAADAVLNPIACHATLMTGQEQQREVSYQCGPGVNLNTAIEANREAWRRGVEAPAPG